MLVKSFLALPKKDQYHLLKQKIKGFKNCEVTSPKNSEKLLVVVMENTNRQSEETTMTRLMQLPCMEHLVLVSSFNE
jgi:nitrate reductase NapAB chaperone NapD